MLCSMLFCVNVSEGEKERVRDKKLYCETGERERERKRERGRG